MRVFYHVIVLFFVITFPKEAWVSRTKPEIQIGQLIANANYIFVVSPVLNHPKNTQEQYVYIINEVLRLPKANHKINDSFIRKISKYLGMTKIVKNIKKGDKIAVELARGFEEIDGAREDWSYKTSSQSILEPLISEDRIILLKKYNSEKNFFTSVFGSGVISLDTKEFIQSINSK